jgi:acetylglutamate kinase
MDRLTIIKIGGKVIENSAHLDSLLRILATSKDKIILIHGGGKKIDIYSEKLGIKVTMVEGRRVTGSETLEVVQMVLAGLLNKNIVSKLQGFQCNAVGLTGADGNLIRAVKRPVKNGVDYGWVGDIVEVNPGFLDHFIKNGMVPVIGSLTHDGNGNILNTNADTVASEIAISMSSLYLTELVYCFDMPGVLKNMSDENSVIPEIRSSEYQKIKSTGAINKGMVPKINSAFEAIQRGVGGVLITNASNIENYLTGKPVTGTFILQ